jgi:hypothetical protein
MVATSTVGSLQKREFGLALLGIILARETDKLYQAQVSLFTLFG